MKKLIFLIILFFSFVISINAYTKSDIVNLASSINVCGSDSISLVNGMKKTYTRLINERDIQQDKLDKIYNNISYVKKVLTDYKVCSEDDLHKLPKDVKNKLYSLYKETNKYITKSPKYVDGKVDDEINVVYDSSNKKIQVYDDGILVDIVGSKSELNYVGMNKYLKYFIISLSLILIGLIILKIIKRKNIFITSGISASIIILTILLVFNNKISVVLDTIYTMNVNVSNKEKEVKAIDNKIISYPSYNSKYATIFINKDSEDIYFGDSTNLLAKGIGHLTSSSLPGEEGTIILSGHNTGLFKNLFNISGKDIIKITTIYGEFTYKYKDKAIVEDTNINSINKDYDLILYTCYPNNSLYGNKRLIIYLDMVDEDWIGDNNEE